MGGPGLSQSAGRWRNSLFCGSTGLPSSTLVCAGSLREKKTNRGLLAEPFDPRRCKVMKRHISVPLLLAVALLVLMVVPTMIYSHYQAKAEGSK